MKENAFLEEKYTLIPVKANDIAFYVNLVSPNQLFTLPDILNLVQFSFSL